MAQWGVTSGTGSWRGRLGWAGVGQGDWLVIASDYRAPRTQKVGFARAR